MIQAQTVKERLREAMDIEGAIGVALVDYVSGMCLGTQGGGPDLNLDVAAAGNTEVVRAKRKVMEQLKLKGDIEDILITLNDQYHLIRVSRKEQGIFFYLALWKNKANLAMARRQLIEIESRT